MAGWNLPKWQNHGGVEHVAEQMVEVTIPRLRVRAAGNGHSMEEEVRQILRKAVGRAKRSRDLASIIRSHFGPEDGVDPELPERDPAREPPSFE